MSAEQDQLELMPRLSLAVYEAEYIEAMGKVAYPVSGDVIAQLTWGRRP